jgi:WD40 repeat protein
VRFLCDLPEMALSVAFHPDGSTLVAGCGDRTLRVFGTADGVQRKVLRAHADWVQGVAFSPSGKHFVTASRDRTARVIDTADWEIDATYNDHDTAVLAAAFSHDGAHVITTARGGIAHLWTPAPKLRRGDFIETGGDVRQIATGSFGIALGGADGAVRLYQEGSRVPWLVLPGHREAIESLAASRNGELVASGSADGEVILWSPHCWEPVLRFRAAP